MSRLVVGPVLDIEAQYQDEEADDGEHHNPGGGQIRPKRLLSVQEVPCIEDDHQGVQSHEQDEAEPHAQGQFAIGHEEAAEWAGVIALTESDALEAVLLVHDSDRGCEP